VRSGRGHTRRHAGCTGAPVAGAAWPGAAAGSLAVVRTCITIWKRPEAAERRPMARLKPWETMDSVVELWP